MIRAILTLAAAALCAPAVAEETQPAGTTEVMVLGTYHFDNPGLDMVNIEADDVLAPQRQADLVALAEALATWKPDRILIEAQPNTPDLSMRSYPEEADARIAEDRNEHFQIGYRLAQMLNHEKVYGFDERAGEGEPDYFPIQGVQEWAAANDKMGEFGALMGRIQTIVAEMSASNSECSIARNLVAHNDPVKVDAVHGLFYYGILGFGDGDNQPGAETNAYWYMRNAKMYAKIDLIAEPGERVLVIVGSGHKYWLDHFSRAAEGYTMVDPTPFLEQADDGRCG